MRITESQLRRIIRQEVRALREGANDMQIIRNALRNADVETPYEDESEWQVEGDVIVHISSGEEVSIPYGSVTPPPAPGYDRELAKEDKPYAEPYAGRVKYDPYD